MREFAKTVWLLTFVIIAVTPVVAIMQSSLRASASIAPPDNLEQFLSQYDEMKWKDRRFSRQDREVGGGSHAASLFDGSA
jgi:hypothetical protein